MLSELELLQWKHLELLRTLDKMGIDAKFDGNWKVELPLFVPCSWHVVVSRQSAWIDGVEYVWQNNAQKVIQLTQELRDAIVSTPAKA